MQGKVKLIRDTFTKLSTLGKLYVNDKYICETLEDYDRDHNRDGDLNDLNETKIHGHTAIPSGKYKMIINVSNRFKKLMPLLIDVPNYAGVRIHSGNTHKDSEGCPIVGMTRGTDFVGQSRIAFMKLMNELAKYDSYEIEISYK